MTASVNDTSAIPFSLPSESGDALESPVHLKGPLGWLSKINETRSYVKALPVQRGAQALCQGQGLMGNGGERTSWALCIPVYR